MTENTCFIIYFTVNSFDLFKKRNKANKIKHNDCHQSNVNFFHFYKKPPPIMRVIIRKTNNDATDTPPNQLSTFPQLIGGFPTTFPVFPFIANVYSDFS